jgi:putative aldouronate transport system substrate-binding protein
MRKFLTVFMLAAFAASAFAGGGQSNQRAASGAAAARGSLPLTRDNVTFKAFIPGLDNQVTSYAYADNTFTKRVVDETGIKLDIIGVASADAAPRLNAMLGSGDYPDLIIGHSMNVGDLSYWGSQGIFLALDKYDIKGWPNIKAMMDEYPGVERQIRGADGNIYALPAVNDCLHCVYCNGRAWYYMPWTRDNKRKVPETIAEFTDFLRWVKTPDLNKNGNPNDEIPIAFAAANMKHFITFIAKAYMPFVKTDSFTGLALNKGKVWEQYRDKEFREALSVMAGWYKDGFISPDSFTMTGDQMRALVHNDTPLLALGFQGWALGRQPSDRWIEYFHLKPLAGPSGLRHASNQDPWGILHNDMIITDKCKNPELAISLYDYFLNFEVEMEGYIGRKGEAWGDPDPGSRSLMGGDPLYKLLVNFGGQRVNGSWNQRNPMNQSGKFRLGEQAKDIDIAQKWWETGDPALRDQCVANGAYNEEANYYWANLDKPWTMSEDYFIPPVALNDADNARISDINAVLKPYLELAWSEFITGRRDISSDAAWNAYLSDLDKMGSKDMAAIYQKYIK